jgi:prepilin-type N-terminal cleavage/methylation domain-containing protein
MKCSTALKKISKNSILNLKTWAGMACAFVSSKGRERMNQNSKGFTLTELMMVVAIMGILGLTGVVSVTKVLPGYQLQKAAREMVSNFRKARSMAIKFNRPVSVVFYMSENRYTVDGRNATAPNLPTYYGSSIRFGYPGRTDDAYFTFYGPVAGVATVDSFRITFNTVGLTTNRMMGYVYLQNSKGQGYRIGLSSLAANIKMDKCGSAGVNCLTNP